MKYKVFELIEPEMLSRTVPDGYDVKTEQGIVLQEIDLWYSGLTDLHDSQLAAMATIVENKDKLKHKNLVILPVVSIDFEGNISGKDRQQ